MQGSLKEGEIEELKSRCDIKDIVGQYINLKKAGKNFVGLCPFHKEKTPSFTVDPGKQLFHCFGCGEGGDVITFIEKIENLDFIEAAQLLAKKVNYDLKFIQRVNLDYKEKKSRLIELNELAKKYYNYILFNNKIADKALNYLKNRGFLIDTLQKFEVGYSPPGWKNFTEFALKKGFKISELIDCGLAIQSSKNNNEVYDRFRDRLMFPIKDVVGQVVGFGGRIVVQESKTKTSKYIDSAKYINTPETKIYSKGKNLYGLFEAKNSIVDEDKVFIVEGYTDVIALWQQGVKNCVASLGTALTNEQVQLISRFTKNIILVFDSDAAGQSASLRSIERLKEYNERLDLFYDGNIDIKVAILEKGYDPAEYVIQKGSDDFLERIKSSVNIIDFTISTIIKKYNIENENLSEKLRAADELIEFISTLSSKIIQEDCIKKISEKLRLRESLLFEQLIKKMQKKALKYTESYLKINPGQQSQAKLSLESKNNLYRVENLEDNTNTNINIVDTNITKIKSKDDFAKLYPVRNIEIEALKIIINGIGSKFEEILNLGSQYFRFNDTRALYEIVIKEVSEAKSKNINVNFPIEISSNKLEESSVKKLYNLIVFSPIHYSDYDMASEEVYNNLRYLYLSDKIDEIKQELKKIENFLIKAKDDQNFNEELAIKKQKAEEKVKQLNIQLKDLELEAIKIKKKFFM